MKTRFLFRMVSLVTILSMLLVGGGPGVRPAKAEGEQFILAAPFADFVHGYKWPLGELITMQVDDPATPDAVDFSQAVPAVPADWMGDNPPTVASFNFHGQYDLKVDDHITISGGGTTEEYTVRPFEITDINGETNTVSGVATPNVSVHVCADTGPGQCRWTVSDGTGAWTTPPYGWDDFVITPGLRFWGVEDDEFGNQTYQNTHLLNPSIGVWGEDDRRVEAYDFALGQPVTVSVYQDVISEETLVYTETQATSPAPWDTSVPWVQFMRPDGVVMTWGTIVVMQGGGVTRTLSFSPITGVSGSSKTDMITGQAAEGIPVTVCLWDGWRCYTAARDGASWTMDFSSIVDLRPGEGMRINAADDDGDLSNLEFQLPNARIEADVWGNRFSLENFSIGNLVDITIQDPNGVTVYTHSFTPDENSNWYDFNPDPPLASGMTIIAENEELRKELVITPIDQAVVDPDARTVSGMSLPGHNININANGDRVPVQIDKGMFTGDGAWSFDFSEIPPDAWVWPFYGDIWDWDSDGDNTYAHWSRHWPVIEVWLVENEIRAFDWPEGIDVTISVDDLATEGVDFTTLVTPVRLEGLNATQSTAVVPFPLKPGMVVTVTDGLTTKDTLVQDLAITGANLSTDQVYGYIPADLAPGSIPDMANGEDYPGIRLFTPNPDGTFTVDYSLPSVNGATVDVSQGDYLRLFLREDDRDSTAFGYTIISGNLSARPNEERVEAGGWPIGDTLTLTIHDQEFTAISNVSDWDPNYNYAKFELAGEMDIQAGDHLSLTNGQITTELVVSPLEITGYDFDADTVEGYAEPGVQVDVWGCMSNSCFPRYVIPDESGYWQANFHDPGAREDEQTPVDFVKGYGGSIDTWQHFAEGNGTNFATGLPNYNVEVRANTDQVETYNWPLGDTLTLIVNHQGELHEFTAPVRVAEWDVTATVASFPLANQYNIGPGDELTVTNGEVTRYLTVKTLRFTEFDEAAETVRGIADPFSQVNIWACPDSNCYNRHITADENGDWLADFAHPGSQGDEQNTVDLVKGMWVDSSVGEPDGDSTLYGRNIPNPRFDLRADGENVDGYEWPAGVILTLTIDGQAGPFEAEVESGYTDWNEENTHAGFSLGGKYDIQPGDVITLSGGGISKTLTVNALMFTGIDKDADIVHGVADPGSYVNIWACPDSNCYNRHITADENGIWQADFSSPGTQPDEQNTVDLVNRTWIDSSVVDEDGDATMFGRSAPNPRFDVRPYDDQVDAYEWPAGATITLTVHGMQFTSVVYTTNMYGDTQAGFYLNGEVDIQAGDVITLSDGVNTTSTTVTGLHFSDFNAAADTVSGYAAAGSWLSIWACDGNNYCPNRWIQADEAGRWTADFATPAGDQGTQDIVANTWVDSRQEDEGGNNTMYGKNIAWVGMYTFLSENRVDSCCWYGEETPQLTITGPGGAFYQATQTPGDDPWGVNDLWYVNFDLGAFALQPDQEATLTYGGITHTHTVQDLWVESYDLQTGLITGHAPAGAHITGGFLGEVDADETGSWTIDASSGAPYPPTTTADVVVQDEDWDATVYNINMGNLFADPDKNTVELKNVPTYREYTLAIDDPDTTELAVDYQLTQVTVESGEGTLGTTGKAVFPLGSYDLQAGDILTLTSGHDTRMLVVQPRVSTTFHVITDQLDGVTQPGGYGVVGAWPGREVQADGAGLWSVDLTTASENLPALDLVPGTSIPVYQYDVDGDLTVYTYTVPMPSRGSLTATGSITSPVGAIAANPGYTGKASFDISAKYGTTGKLSGALQFSVKGLTFASTSLDWLVVEGTRAQLAGQGKVAGKSGYSFLLSVAKDTNTLRLRIWKTATGEAVYDSMPATPDWVVPVTPINKGGTLKLAQ